ncbi:serine/threonine protein kinase [Paenibacillus alkaliterrae]|uniref:serine/threonine protein kinase n=1 Tax=Paenibacillus alkaliterrae TaxID=320909 RepID=UPI001F485656|nr:serine/threonine-protein kinase [Paenibacillus alkaliterrae]MCF2938282.1 serine/threonine protein kinase [Paenibacillus alkaliterrae]
MNRDMSISQLNTGDIIGERYRIVGMIGKGGMGVVYAVEDLKLGSMLRAVKITSQQTDGSLAYSEEAVMLMKLNHPHLPQIIDYLKMGEQGYSALVMDYFQGQTIAAYYGKLFAGFTYQQIVHIALQLCSALRYLHGQDPPIIHRDLKPSNVMVDSKGLVKLIDFGISRYYKEGGSQDTVQLGTVGFAAPEQGGNNGQSDGRTDIYGLGALLYYMATGGTVFRRDDRLLERKDPFALMQADVSHDFKAFLDRMLQPVPSSRYRSMAEVEQELKSIERQSIRKQEEGSFREAPPLFHPEYLLISMISLSPGAGASFLTLTLAALLGHRNKSVSAVEYSGLRPEWHAILSQRDRQTMAASSGKFACDDRYIQYIQQDHKVNWLAINPVRMSKSVNEEQIFERMLGQTASSINIIDLSHKWQEPQAIELLRQSRVVIAVGDPAVFKWQAAELQKLNQLETEIQNNGGSLAWIANKDIDFEGRKEWLTLFPSRPLAVIPRLSSHSILQAQWAGRWITDHAQVRKRMLRAFQPVFTLLYNEINTN